MVPRRSRVGSALGSYEGVSGPPRRFQLPGLAGRLRRPPAGVAVRQPGARLGMHWSSNLRGCNQLAGWFVVDSVTYTAGVISALDLEGSSSAARLQGPRCVAECDGNVSGPLNATQPSRPLVGDGRHRRRGLATSLLRCSALADGFATDRRLRGCARSPRSTGPAPPTSRASRRTSASRRRRAAGSTPGGRTCGYAR